MNNKIFNTLRKNFQNKWRYIIIVTILVVGLGVVVGTDYLNAKKLDRFSSEEISCIDINENINLDEINKGKVYYLNKGIEYLIGDGKFKSFKSHGDYYDAIDLKVYNKDKEIMEINNLNGGADTSLWCFTYKNNKYVILNGIDSSYRETINYIFFITPTNELKLVKSIKNVDYIYTGYIGLPSLLFKDGKLYIKIRDHRFERIFGVSSDVFYIRQYFLVDGERIILASSDFKEDYIDRVQGIKCNYFEGFNLLSCIVEVTVDYLLANEEETAWKVAEEFLKQNPSIKDLDGNRITLDYFKREIKSRLAMPL